MALRGARGAGVRAGPFLACAAGDFPVVVTRDGEGTLRAFLNVCRHRGSVIAAGSGHRMTLQCPYHAWTYGLDGSLVAAPRADREGSFDPDELGLVPAAVDSWGPFLFVSVEPDATLTEALGDVPQWLDVEGLVFHRRADWVVEANWKIACENYLECYHCAVGHPGFSEVVDVSPDAYRLEANGRVASQYGPARDGGLTSQFHFVWPNLKINVFPGEPNLSIGHVLPAGPECATGFLDYFFAPGVDEEWLGDFFELDEQVGFEDAALVENVQQGVRTGVLERGHLLAESEQLVAWFQARVAEALA
ncbi:MAG: aromatic ring-hydroxylating dioxygenase subunit alpha [Gaiellaceae bacterium]